MQLNENTEFDSFRSFWPFYISEHSLPATRCLHFIGTVSILPLIILAFFTSLYVILLYPVFGYLFSWMGHFLFEKNKPATFKYPVWSLMADYKMFWLILTGRMQNEFEKHRQ